MMDVPTLYGPVLRLAGHAHQPAQRPDQPIIAGTVLERSRGPERADGAVDERRLRRAQRVGVEAELGGRARTQILNDDIGALHDELSQARAFGGIPEVDHGRSLVAVEALEGGGHAAPIGRRPTARIVTVGLLDLDDVGTEVTEDSAGVRCRDTVPELDHGDTVKRQEPRHSHSGILHLGKKRDEGRMAFFHTITERSYSMTTTSS